MKQGQDKIWLVTGASGLLGHHAVNRLVSAGYKVEALENTHRVDFTETVNIHQGDLARIDWIENLVRELKPDVVLHCAGLTDVNRCEREPELARKLHIDASAALAREALECGARFIHISTDHLWDGTKTMVAEDEPVAPLNVYGQTKADGEKAVLAAYPGALVVRTNFFGHGLPWRASFSDWLENKLKDESEFLAFTDIFFTPIEVGYLCDTIIKLSDMDVSGVLHVAGSERLSKFDFAVKFARRFGLDENKIKPGKISDVDLLAPRPHDMSLGTSLASELLGEPMADISTSLELLAANL